MTMSDCSTNAMRPKEPPKTCGNCEIITSNASKDIVCPVRVIGACDNWRPRTDALEQRCQQLEQVAKELYKEYEQIEVELCDFIGYGKLRDKYVGGTVFKSHLANLGVSLDD